MLSDIPEDNTDPGYSGFEFGVVICQVRVCDKNENILKFNWVTNDHTFMGMVPIGPGFPIKAKYRYPVDSFGSGLKGCLSMETLYGAGRPSAGNVSTYDPFAHI